ncbi:MAG: winged helix-turn-helix domain-containing protein [Candidatus Bathyarchaeota archaeon]|nr:winged helix-turn-helix domain-containing protein [Candidatus Bathyarchaeota archaeon]
MAASLKKFMQQIAGKKAPGPSTTFTIFHVFYSLELMAQKPLGRNKLAEKLNVGDGAVRTIISRLKDAGLIETSKEGCNLTKKGLEIWRQFEEIFPKRVEIPRSELAESEFNFAFLVKSCGQKVKSGIDQRDAAIIAGARKALVIVFKNGHLSIESVSDCVEKQYPKAANLILKELAPEENDVIIVAGADSALKAKRGAFAASWSLIGT